MFWFKKEKAQEKEEEVTRIEIPCKHRYRDFPWYIISKYYNDEHMYDIYVKEPYVCVWCGNREDKILEHIRGRGPRNAGESIADAIKAEYGSHLRGRAEIEDMINDMQLVDRDYLRALAVVNPEALNGMDQNAQVALKKA